MRIVEFSEKAILLNKGKSILLIADFRNIGYSEENNTIQRILAEKYNIELYPIIFYTPLILPILVKHYSDYDVWIIDRSLLNDNFSEFWNLFSENISIRC